MSKRETKRQPVVVLTVGIAIIAVLVVFKDAIQHKITLTAALKETAVNAELIYELAENSSDPLEVYEAFWNTEKIPHRLAALRAYNRSQDPDRKNLPAWVQDATMDSDLHVRELALAILAAVRAPELEAVVHTCCSTRIQS